MDLKPVVSITMGDPAGVGPEICLKALREPAIHEVCHPVVIGSAAVLGHYADALNLPAPEMLPPSLIDRASDLRTHLQSHGRGIYVLNTGEFSKRVPEIGKITAAGGSIAQQCIEKSIALCIEGIADAVATAPINKESLVATGSPYIDHTEMYAKITNSKAVTMFEVDLLRIFFLTRHVSLRGSVDLITHSSVASGIRSCHENLVRLGFAAPRIAVAALNPHAGEGGLFGREEIDLLEPAVREASNQGIAVVGPVPADAVFAHALKGRYDAVLSLYHDQGHIAAKTYDFERTVSVTLGLPFIRTSVDHGTAFDIAGKGIADATSMIEAIKCAARYALAWKQSR